MTFMPVENLVEAPWNYKMTEPEKMGRFLSSLRRNGFIYPLVVAQRAEEPENDLFEVCDGNHRLQALVTDGSLAEIPVIDLGRLSSEERKRVGVELNEWEFKTNLLDYAAIVQELSATFPDLPMTFPLDQGDIDGLERLAKLENEKLLALVEAEIDKETGEVEVDAPEVLSYKDEIRKVLPQAILVAAKGLGIEVHRMGWRAIWVMVEERADEGHA